MTASVAEANGDGPIPEGWESTQLVDIGNWSTGGTPSRKQPSYFGGPIRWVKSGDLCDGRVQSTEEGITRDALENSAAKVLPAGSLLIALYGATIGKLGVLSIDAATNQACAGCRINGAVASPWLLFYYLLSQRQKLIEAGQGGAQPNLTNEIVRNWTIDLPPLAEQRRIVAKVEELLARVNAARERLAKIPAILKRFRQSILAAACSGQLTANWREEEKSLEPADEMLTRLGISLAPLRSDLNLSEIPDGWCWVSLRTLMDRHEAFCYGVVQPGEDNPAGVFLVRAGDLKKETVNTAELRRIPQAVNEAHSRSRLRGGELLVTVVGAGIGESAIAPQECVGFNIARAIAKIPIRQNSATYVLRWFQSQTARGWMDDDAREVARPTLNLEQLQTLPVPLPPLTEQSEIVRRVEALFALANKIEARLQAATARVEKITQAILAKAFRGELVPTEAELARRESRPYEPASALLERIRAERASAESNGAASHRHGRATTTKSRPQRAGPAPKKVPTRRTARKARKA